MSTHQQLMEEISKIGKELNHKDELLENENEKEFLNVKINKF